MQAAPSPNAPASSDARVAGDRSKHRRPRIRAALLTRARLALLAATALYALSIYFAYVEYLYPAWEYMGFTFRPLGASEVVVVVTLLTAAASTMPVGLSRASAVILMLLYLVVFVPGIVVTFCLDAHRLDQYLPFALALTAVSCVAGWLCSRSPASRPGPRLDPSNAFLAVLSSLWVAMAALLLLEYRGVMSFVALDNVYEQRAAGASTGTLIAYVQTYFSNVVNPALIAAGLVYKRRLSLLMGVSGCVLMYAINAQKVVLLLPLAMVALDALLRGRLALRYGVSTALLVFGTLTFYAASRWETDVVAGALAVFLVNRTIAIPGLTLSQYFDHFSTEAFTYWSHVKGLDLLIDAPAKFSADPLWPGLGYILGDRLFGMPEFNMNANLFAGDGIAAAGSAGIIVVGLALIAFLLVLDWVSSRWNQRFVVLVVFPVGLSLTNGHLFTTLLSFGGLFWVLTFALAGGSRQAAASRQEIRLP
ncbi:MAG: hypothetical protein AB1670_18355 [Pseudomonadota bacterium]